MRERFRNRVKLIGGNQPINGAFQVALESMVGGTGLLDPDSQTSYENGTPFEPGDVLFGKLRPYLAKVWLADRPGFAVGDIHVYRPTGAVDPAFLRYFVLNPQFVREVDSGTYGAKMPRADWGDIREIEVKFPPPSAQVEIASVLDRETSQIDQMIEAQGEVIRLAEEHRLALIAYEIDTLPSQGHELVQLRHCVRIQNGVTLGKDYGDEAEEYPYLRVANVQAGYLDLDEIKTVAVSPAVAAATTLRAGDVLITEGGDRAALGRGALWRDEVPGALHQNHIYALRCRTGLDPEFLVYALDAPSARNYFESTRRQTTNLSSTNAGKVKAFKLPRPPLGTQKEIVQKLHASLRDVDETISAANDVITLLRERRNALINAAVTGRIDPMTGKERPQEAS